jgi:hypothetical protein
MCIYQSIIHTVKTKALIFMLHFVNNPNIKAKEGHHIENPPSLNYINM